MYRHNLERTFAGSAIAQGAHRIDNLETWAPGFRDRSWLLLCGATDPPSEVKVSKRRPRNDRTGAFLHGATLDLRNMENTAGPDLHNTVKNLRMTKGQAMFHIRELFNHCLDRRRTTPMLYYTGHGEEGTGDWCFHNGTISIEEIFSLVLIGDAFGRRSDSHFSKNQTNHIPFSQLSLPDYHQRLLLLRTLGQLLHEPKNQVLPMSGGLS